MENRDAVVGDTKSVFVGSTATVKSISVDPDEGGNTKGAVGHSNVDSKSVDDHSEKSDTNSVGDDTNSVGCSTVESNRVERNLVDVNADEQDWPLAIRIGCWQSRFRSRALTVCNQS